MAVDHKLVKLGKGPRKYDRRTLRLARYLTPSLPAPPVSVDNTGGVASYGMMMNDSLGDCTIAGCGHAIQIWTLSAGNEITVPDSTILQYYELWDGYNPSDPSTDQGGVELDVLNDWQGSNFGGHQIQAYVSVDPQDTSHVQSAIQLFGGLYIGLALPVSAQNQSPWDYVPDASLGDPTPGSWGGHCVFVPAYDQNGLTCITWGELQKMTWAFWNEYCVSSSSRILTEDLRWRPAGDLKQGDRLMGFDDRRQGIGVHRRWCPSRVLSTRTEKSSCLRLIFEDGTELTCTPNHPLLCMHDKNQGWIRAENLRVDKTMPSRVVKPLPVWGEATGYKAGYLAAALDGEGNLIQSDLSRRVEPHQGVSHTAICFSQKPNPMLDTVREYLIDMGMTRTTFRTPDDGVGRLTIGHRSDVLTLLGSVRPKRLLSRFNPAMMGCLSNGRGPARLVAREAMGEREVSVISTSTGTFLSEGLASHNCDEAYALLEVEWQPPTGFDMPTLQADLNLVTG